VPSTEKLRPAGEVVTMILATCWKLAVTFVAAFIVIVVEAALGLATGPVQFTN